METKGFTHMLVMAWEREDTERLERTEHVLGTKGQWVYPSPKLPVA